MKLAMAPGLPRRPRAGVALAALVAISSLAVASAAGAAKAKTARLSGTTRYAKTISFNFSKGKVSAFKFVTPDCIQTGTNVEVPSQAN